MFLKKKNKLLGILILAVSVSPRRAPRAPKFTLSYGICLTV